MKVSGESARPKHSFLVVDEDEESSRLNTQLVLFAEANFESETDLSTCVWELARCLEFSEDEGLLSNPVFTGTNTIDHLISVVRSDVSINTKCGAVAALGAVLERMSEADQESLVRHDVTGYIVNLFRECDNQAADDLHHIILYIARVANLNQCACQMVLSQCPFQFLLERARDLKARDDATSNFAALVQLIYVISPYEMPDEDREFLLRFAIDVLRPNNEFSDQTSLWLVQSIYYMARNCPERVAECEEWIDLCLVMIRQGTPRVAKRVMNTLNYLYDRVPRFHCDCYGILVDQLTADNPTVVRDCVRLIKVMIDNNIAELETFVRARIVKSIATCMMERPFSHKTIYLRLVRFLCRQGDLSVMKQLVKFEVYANLPWDLTDDAGVGKLLVEISELLFGVISVNDAGLLVRLKSQYDSADAASALRQMSEQADANIKERIEALVEKIDGMDMDEILGAADAEF